MTAPACDPTTLSDDLCAGGCGRRYHHHRHHRHQRGSTRACVNGHPRLAGHGYCPGCYSRRRRREHAPTRNDGQPVDLRLLHDHGACRGADLELFFPSPGPGQNVKPLLRPVAEQYCLHCPVADECHRYAEQHRELGMWAGMWRSLNGNRYSRSPVLPETARTAS